MLLKHSQLAKSFSSIENEKKIALNYPKTVKFPTVRIFWDDWKSKTRLIKKKKKFRDVVHLQYLNVVHIVTISKCYRAQRKLIILLVSR